MVGPPAARAPRWAAPSTPIAAPETTVNPMSPARRRARPLCARRSRWRRGLRRSRPPGRRVRPARPVRGATTRWAMPGRLARAEHPLGCGCAGDHRPHGPRRSQPRLHRVPRRETAVGGVVQRGKDPVRPRRVLGVRSRRRRLEQARGLHRRGQRRGGPPSPRNALRHGPGPHPSSGLQRPDRRHQPRQSGRGRLGYS